MQLIESNVTKLSIVVDGTTWLPHEDSYIFRERPIYPIACLGDAIAGQWLIDDLSSCRVTLDPNEITLTWHVPYHADAAVVRQHIAAVLHHRGRVLRGLRPGCDLQYAPATMRRRTIALRSAARAELGAQRDSMLAMCVGSKERIFSALRESIFDDDLVADVIDRLVNGRLDDNAAWALIRISESVHEMNDWGGPYTINMPSNDPSQSDTSEKSDSEHPLKRIEAIKVGMAKAEERLTWNDRGSLYAQEKMHCYSHLIKASAWDDHTIDIGDADVATRHWIAHVAITAIVYCDGDVLMTEWILRRCGCMHETQISIHGLTALESFARRLMTLFQNCMLSLSTDIRSRYQAALCRMWQELPSSAKNGLWRILAMAALDAPHHNELQEISGKYRISGADWMAGTVSIGGTCIALWSAGIAEHQPCSNDSIIMRRSELCIPQTSHPADGDPSHAMMGLGESDRTSHESTTSQPHRTTNVSPQVRSPARTQPSRPIDAHPKDPLAHHHSSSIVSLRDRLTDIVAGQPTACHQMAISMKEHIHGCRGGATLIRGPTGCGKSHMLHAVAHILDDIPIAHISAPAIVPEGIRGRTISHALLDLYRRSGNNIALAQRGIIAFDEFDKIATSPSDNDYAHTLINNILRILDGEVWQFGSTEDRPPIPGLSTAGMLIVLCGSWQQTHEERKEHIGFMSSTSIHDNSLRFHEELHLTSELKGRIARDIQMTEHTADSIEHLLNDREHSPWLSLRPVIGDLFLPTPALNTVIALAAVQEGLGVRSAIRITRACADAVVMGTWSSRNVPDVVREALMICVMQTTSDINIL